jgi:hypothetical protein
VQVSGSLVSGVARVSMAGGIGSRNGSCVSARM